MFLGVARDMKNLWEEVVYAGNLSYLFCCLGHRLQCEKRHTKPLYQSSSELGILAIIDVRNIRGAYIDGRGFIDKRYFITVPAPIA
jgi:hypothetical protein